MRERLENRPTKGALTIPYMVDESRNPIDFKAVDAAHVEKCARGRRCGVCGGKIRSGPIAFIGPAKRAGSGRAHYERCFADPWMHPDCAERAMTQCPFLAGRRGWRENADNPLIAPHAFNMVLVLAPDCRSHKDAMRNWHFEAVGELTYPEVAA